MGVSSLLRWTVGFIKGKSAIHLARVYGERKRNFVGQHFWARGFFVSTVGRDEGVIRDYIRNQEKEGRETGPAWPMEMIGHRGGGPSNEGPR
jgi:REP element-mobilizing transposase RayT